MGTLPAAGKLCRCYTSPGSEKPVYPEKILLTRAIETFYDNCAAYNLRYVPYRTVTDQVCLQTIAKDLVVLFCFVATSFVILLTILSRTAMHLGQLCSEGLQWSKDYLRSYQKAGQKPCCRAPQTSAPTPVAEALVKSCRRRNSTLEQPQHKLCFTEHLNTDVRVTERIIAKYHGNNQKSSQEKKI